MSILQDQVPKALIQVIGSRSTLICIISTRLNALTQTESKASLHQFPLDYWYIQFSKVNDHSGHLNMPSQQLNIKITTTVGGSRGLPYTVIPNWKSGTCLLIYTKMFSVWPAYLINKIFLCELQRFSFFLGLAWFDLPFHNLQLKTKDH